MTSEERQVSREIRIGLALIGVLVVALSWAVARRFLGGPEAPPAALGNHVPGAASGGPQSPQRQPMVLPRSNRYTGPGAFVEPQPLSPPEGVEAGGSPLPDPRPSLLPTLPPSVDPDFIPPEASPWNSVGEPLDDEPETGRGSQPPASDDVLAAQSRAVQFVQPAAGTTPGAALAGGPGRPYLVEEGDTPAIIARFELGDASRWPEIFAQNRDSLEHADQPLRPGTWIILPAPTTAAVPDRGGPSSRYDSR
jgi:hypothetical protein